MIKAPRPSAATVSPQISCQLHNFAFDIRSLPIISQAFPYTEEKAHNLGIAQARGWNADISIMVAGLSRNSHNASNHFMPTRPTKEEVNQRSHYYHEPPSKPSLVLRPRNNPESTFVGGSKPKKSNDMRMNGTKRSSMTSQKAPVSPVDRGVANEARRRYVLRPQIGYTSTSAGSMMFSPILPDLPDQSLEDEQVVSGILDGITSLCLGPTTQASSGFQTGVSSKSYRLSPRIQRRKKKVVYPIVSYPARLNCQKLVSERRAVFHQNLFRPVSSDESSLYQSVRA